MAAPVALAPSQTHVAVADAVFANMIAEMETSGSVDKMRFAKDFANSRSDGSMTPSPDQLADAVSKVWVQQASMVNSTS